MTKPLQRGISALIAVFSVLLAGGLVMQVRDAWASQSGDALWLAAFLDVGVIAVIARDSSGGKAPLLSRVAAGLLGLYGAVLMAYWIALDGGYLPRFGWPIVIPVVLFGVLAIVGGLLGRSVRSRSARADKRSSKP